MNQLVYRSELDRLVETVGEEQLQKQVCDAIIEGMQPVEIASKLAVTYADLWRWLSSDDDRYKEYQRSLEGKADKIFHEAVSISDEADVETANVAAKKLRAEIRMRAASRWDRNRYGEQQNVQISGNVSLITLLSSLPRGTELIEGESERVDGGITEKISKTV